MNEPVTIDSEFQSLIPPLSSEEFQQLTENCKRDGIMDSLKVWNGILIDGHNRYRIAEEWDLNYQTEEMEFPDRTAVRRWIIKNQLGRRNLNTYNRSVLALELEPIIQTEAEKNLHQGHKPLEKSTNPVNTREEVAKIAETSSNTIRKVKAIENSGDEEIKQAARSGEISVHKAFQLVQEQQTPKPPKTTNPVFEAKQRHEEYIQKKQEGVISLQDARQDKEDRKRIAENLYNDLLSITTKSYWLSALNTASDFDALADVIPDDKKQSMMDRIEKMMVVLNKVMEVLNESKIRG